MSKAMDCRVEGPVCAAVAAGGARRVALLWLVSLLLSPAVASAEPPPLPDALSPYADWVVSRDPTRRCPVVEGSAVCAWPGTLSLRIDDAGGRFEQRVHTDRSLQVQLPGSAEHWPREVRLGAGPAVVLSRGELPVVSLPAGDHVLSGRFAWTRVPEVIAVPERIAAVALTLDGVAVPAPRRDGATLWLASSARDAEEGERLQLQVHRRIMDGVPMRVLTRIVVRASGRARELPLGEVLLPGTVPISLTADIPAKLEPGGTLSAQVRAGEFSIEVLARYTASPKSIVAPKLSEPWPQREVWVFVVDELSRQVELSGVPGIDPARTELPEAWRDAPAFSVSAGGELALKTRRRGQPEPPPNQLALERDLWLDLDGGGFTVRDHITGALNRSFRLDLAAGELGHAAEDGVDQLITKSEDGKSRGVELRDGALSLVAEWRGEGGLSDISAVGWSEDVSSLGAQLHLPPGYLLLWADGVDEVNTWLGRWDLLDFFLVLLVALSVGRLFGVGVGALSLVTTALCVHEDDAPLLVWLSLVVCVALLRVVRPGRGRKLLSWVFGAVLLSLVAIALPFVADQVRAALYPQLDRAHSPQPLQFSPAQAGGERAPLSPPAPQAAAPDDEVLQVLEMAEEEAIDFEEDRAAGLPMASSEPPRQAKVAARRMGKRALEAPGRGGYGLLGGKGSSGPDWLADLGADPAAVVQTGPGVPSWQFRSIRLGWSGPVEKRHRIALLVLPPPVTRLLSVLRVLLVLALGLLLVRAGRAAHGAPPPGGDSGGGDSGGGDNGGTAGAAVTALLLSLTLLSAAPLRAQTPDAQLLSELEQRLTEPPACRPDCLDVAHATLRVVDGTLSYTAQVHAGETTSVRLPGPARSFTPAAVRVGGFPSHAMVLREDGFIHLRVPAGRRETVVSGPVPPGDTLTLALADTPRSMEIEAEGFEVSGLREDGRPGGNLVLSRSLPSEGTGEAMSRSELPAYTVLERTLVIGTTWQVRSRLTRYGPTGTPVVVALPLLPGESVTDAGVEIEGGRVQVSLGRDDTGAQWQSTLSPRDGLSLTAMEGQGVTERWTLQCGPVWHCNPEGLSPARHMRAGRWAPEFWPWPGETLELSFRRPEAAEGVSTTIDNAELSVTPGVRMLEAKLQLDLRSSVGGVHTLTLPKDAKVQLVQVGGEERTVRQQDGKLSLQLHPGRTLVYLTWQQPGGMAAMLEVPKVDLGARAANARVWLHVPESRVLLWATGPAWGPAVLFWGYLVLVLLLAVALSRMPDSPLSLPQWLLLSLGLSQVPLAALLVVVGWFFAMARRGRRVPDGPRQHNLMQLLLIAWTLAAAGCLYAAVHGGLLMRPDMQVEGAASGGGALQWIVDDVAGTLPQPGMWSMPLWLWKIGMLLWALWLSASLVRWLPWAWQQFSHVARFRPWGSSPGVQAAREAREARRAALREKIMKDADRASARADAADDAGDAQPSEAADDDGGEPPQGS